jgi:predicted oxidoreductase
MSDIPIFLGTMGGVKINHKTKAVDEYGSPIPDLYVVGSMRADSTRRAIA